MDKKQKSVPNAGMNARIRGRFFLYIIGKHAQKIILFKIMSKKGFVESTKVIHIKKGRKADKMDLCTELYTLSTGM